MSTLRRWPHSLGLSGLRAGDSPLNVRGRPSSLKRDCDRRTMSTGEGCLVTGSEGCRGGSSYDLIA
jgi:hypothetical protein